MGRHREFDSAQALERALDIFWRQGYRGTSISDLEAAMGIGRTSIYSTFGDKEALFFAALDLYVERHMRPSLDRLTEMADVRTAILDHFRALRSFLTDPQLPLGCLLTNVATECDRGSSPLGRKLAMLIGRNESALYQALRNGQARGEIGPAVDVRAVARYFAMAIQGMSVMAKAYLDPAALDDVVASLSLSIDALLGRMPAAEELDGAMLDEPFHAVAPGMPRWRRA